MTSEQERWAFAAKLLEMHGDRIGDYVAERADHFREHGNQDALIFWEDITMKFIQLMAPDDGSKPQ